MITTLYPIFRHWSVKGSVWLLSDLHFEDENCMAMDSTWILPEAQIDIINKLVHSNDTFVCLGDVGNPEWISKIRARFKVLIMGNHDSSSTKLAKFFNEVYEGPLFVSEKLLLSHEPIILPYVFNIHGHCHDPEEQFPDDFHHLNLACNIAGFTPVNLKDVILSGALRLNGIHRTAINSACNCSLKLSEQV